MKISQIKITPYEIKLKEPFIISLGKMTHAKNVVVRIEADEGLVGYGECSPFLTINGESHETGKIVGEYLKKSLMGMNPLDIPSCILRMDEIIYGNSSIKSAFDMALHDIASQAESLPLFRYLGGELRPLTTDYTVSLNDSDEMVRQAIWIKEQGFPAVKVKLGESADKDIQRIKAIRKAIGANLPLQLDANQGWDFDEAVEVLNALKNEGVAYCEEPISRSQFMRLPELKNSCPIPIMADESCGDHIDAQRLIDIQACQMINIKLGKSGGIHKAAKIVSLGEKHNIEMQVGGFLESRLAFTASAHLALSSKNITHCDFDTPLMFEEDPVIGGIKYGPGGSIEVPDVPGLGARIDL